MIVVSNTSPINYQNTSFWVSDRLLQQLLDKYS